MARFVDLLSSLPLAEAEKAAKTGAGSLFEPLGLFLVIGVLFYFLMIRPDRRKRSEMQEMLRQLKKNDRVVTIGGIYGTVVSTSKDSEEVTLKIDENTNTKVRMQRNAIARVLSDESNSPTKGGS